MRFRVGEISPRRVADAVGRRLANIPDVLAWYRSPLGLANQAALEAFRDKHRGERCFLMANGPSLGHMDLSPLRDEITIGLNRVYLLFDQLGFEPTYFGAVNELIAEQFHEDILKLGMPKFLGWHRRTCFQKERDTLPPNTSYLRDFLAINDRFSRDVTRGVTSGGTVTYQMLQVLYFMGFSEVILIGLDHSFVEKGRPNMVQTRTGPDSNHFHPDYWPKGSKWQLPDLHRSELAYASARLAFEQVGRVIVDATDGGKCQVFRKARFEDVVARPVGGLF
jgi:hypothetical protein